MNNVSIIELENKRIELLKKYGLDEKSIIEFRSKIKTVSEDESNKLGEELLGSVENVDKVIELVYKGANIEYKSTKKGIFPLLVCARKNYIDSFIVLLKAGANINQVNEYLTTATMGSARHGNKEILEILILMGADINVRCLDGDNALMSAKRHNNIECFNMLVQASAYLNNRNLKNQSVIDIPSEVEFDLSQVPSSVFDSNVISFEDTQKLLNDATEEMKKINKLSL